MPEPHAPVAIGPAQALLHLERGVGQGFEGHQVPELEAGLQQGPGQAGGGSVGLSPIKVGLPAAACTARGLSSTSGCARHDARSLVVSPCLGLHACPAGSGTGSSTGQPAGQPATRRGCQVASRQAVWLCACLRLQFRCVHLKGQAHPQVQGGDLPGEARGALHLHLGPKLRAVQEGGTGTGVGEGGLGWARG